MSAGDPIEYPEPDLYSVMLEAVECYKSRPYSLRPSEGS